MPPIHIKFSESDIADLRSRIKNTRWPSRDLAPEGSGHHLAGYGVESRELKPALDKWANFDFAAFEADLNTQHHFMDKFNDVDLHYVYKKSSHHDAVPLLLLHGWPQCIVEFWKVIDALAEPPEGHPAFHVVVPSHPGYFLSSLPDKEFSLKDEAYILDQLMLSRGFLKYAAHGGDWGSAVARVLGASFPHHCVAVHVSFIPPHTPRWAALLPMSKIMHTAHQWGLISPTILDGAKRGLDFVRIFAYYKIQKTTPQTAAFELTDSPAGLLAWIYEKTAKWGKTDVDFPLRVSSLFWLYRNIGPSFHFYCFNPPFTESVLDSYVPNLAYSNFPGELASTSPRMVNWSVGRLNWYKEAPEGGHYPAYTHPDIFVDHLRDAISTITKDRL